MSTLTHEQRIQALQQEYNEVVRAIQAIKDKATVRKNMTVGDILKEMDEKMTELGDEYLEEVLARNEPAKERLAHEGVAELKKEKEYKINRGLDELEVREKKLFAELVAARGPQEALAHLERYGRKLDELWAGHSDDPQGRATMREIMELSAMSEKRAQVARAASNDKARSRDDRSHSKYKMRKQEAIVKLLGMSRTGEPYYAARENLKPYAEYLRKNHKSLLAASHVSFVKRMGGVQEPSNTGLPQITEDDGEEEHSIGRLSLRQSMRYFGGRRLYARW